MRRCGSPIRRSRNRFSAGSALRRRPFVVRLLRHVLSPLRSRVTLSPLSDGLRRGPQSFAALRFSRAGSHQNEEALEQNILVM
jgi:hypothetical protein